MTDTSAIRIGAHVEQTDPIAEAKARNAPLVQFFLGNPQSYKGPVLAYEGGPEKLRADAEAAGVDLYVHAPYLINVATTNNRQRIPSRKLLQQHMDAAGGTNAMTRYLERIAGVWDAIAAAEGADMVGFCLDTCHAHAGGNPLETVVDDVRKITGRIDLVHCNDSRDDFDSGADRHANFGAGRIDPDLLAAVVRDAGAPVVCETPGGAEEHQADFAWLRERTQ